jgi:hypothetical protein
MNLLAPRANDVSHERALGQESVMNNHDLVATLQTRAPIPVDRDVLVSLLEEAEVLRQENTCVAYWIRILSVDGAILVQEETPEGNALARRMPSIEDANAFVNDRLATYERMWDGCGCKINYFD